MLPLRTNIDLLDLIQTRVYGEIANRERTDDLNPLHSLSMHWIVLLLRSRVGLWHLQRLPGL